MNILAVAEMESLREKVLIAGAAGLALGVAIGAGTMYAIGSLRELPVAQESDHESELREQIGFLEASFHPLVNRVDRKYVRS